MMKNPTKNLILPLNIHIRLTHLNMDSI